ncbi:MAG: ABC transporter substrate-binding protein [Candidatus Binatia bacterium]
MTRPILRLLLALTWFSLLSLPDAKAIDDVKIASTGPAVSTLPLEIAARKGFFRDEGLEVLTITMRTNIAVNALLTRNVDYATPSTSIIKAATGGLPVKLVSVLQGRPDYFLIAKREIRSIKDLKGKRIAIGSFGATADLALRTVITEEGLDFDRDLVRLQMGGNSARYVSLVTGTVDATVLSPPFNLQAENAGFKDLLWLGERLELPLAGLGVRDEAIQQNPKQILAMIRAVFRAMAFAKAHPEETMRMLVSWAKVDQAVAAKSYDLGKRSWSESGAVSDAAVKVVVSQSMLELKLKDAVSLDKVRNWTFAEQARRELEKVGPAR